MIKKFIRMFLNMLRNKEMQVIQRGDKFYFEYDGEAIEAGYVEAPKEHLVPKVYVCSHRGRVISVSTSKPTNYREDVIIEKLPLS